MGSGRWSDADWASYSSTAASKSTDAIFKSSASTFKDYLNPKGIAVRESRDSTDNPQSTAIIVGIDVTGSMGMIADALARDGLGTLFTEVLTRRPVTDPHLMFMAIGDANCDRYPLQVSQFEADNRIVDQLTDIYLEKGGGGNSFESYNLPWYFAGYHTSIDCYEKRGKKGYLFTIGDEEAPYDLTAAQIEQITGDKLQQKLSNAELLDQASKMYHIFHIIVEQGSHARSYPDRVKNSWQNVLGQRVLMLSDYTKLSEVIVSAIQVVEGVDKVTVASSWSGSTSMVVSKAISGLTAVTPATSAATGVVRF